MTELELLLSEIDARVKRDLPLSSVSTFRIGGNASFVIYPETAEALVLAVRALKRVGLRFEVFGNASNVLFSDNGYDGAIIITKRISDIHIEDNRIVCGAGAMLPAISARAAERSLTGLEFACGIPATLGGAVAMNAGAHGGEISDVLIKCTVYDSEKDEIFELSAKECDFSYRHSVFSENGNFICLGATLAPKYADEAEIRAKMKEYSEKRRAAQPLDKPSAGSFFKRPEGHFAARLIDECGLKGCRVGGACVSEKHAGFIVNLGGATCADVLAVAEIVSKTVFESTGVELEREVRLVPREED